MSHVKDSVMGENGKLYKVDLAQTFGIAKASGYKGFFSMEAETANSGPYAGTERLIRETLRYIS
jgi:hypothetical protein